MGDDERRKRKLTPLSGELRADADWAPPAPVAEPRRVKKEKALPQTRGQMIVAGIRRALVILVLLGGLIALVGALIVWLFDTEPARAFPLAFYLGGATIAVGGFLGGTTGPSADWMPEGGFDREEREEAFNMSIVYAVFGGALIGVGVLLESLL